MVRSPVMKTLLALAALLLLVSSGLSAQELTWKPFRSAADGFSVDLPGTPRFVEEKDRDIVHRRYTLGFNGRGFNVTCSDYGENIPEKFIERLMTGYRDSLVARTKAKLLEDQALKCGPYAGRKFALSGREGWWSVKMCVAGRRSCVAQATNSKGPWSADVVARFHNSFKLFPPAAK